MSLLLTREVPLMNWTLLCQLIVLYFVFSVLGWMMEVTLKYIQYHRFINRGFLIGPYCPIYGSGVVLVTVLVGGLGKVVTLTRWPRVILEAVLKVAIFLSYMVAISKMKEIHRVFEYHGAEHKTIACYEAGDELTVENVRKYTRFHPRCGTSFLILVVIVSVFLYSVLPWSSTSLRVLFKLLLLPVVMGISYELLKWCGRSDNIATRIIRQPGLWVQRLTVFEPDDSMIEVAIAAVTPVLPEDPEDGKW